MRNNQWVLNLADMENTEAIRFPILGILPWRRRKCERVHILMEEDFFLQQIQTLFFYSMVQTIQSVDIIASNNRFALFKAFDVNRVYPKTL